MTNADVGHVMFGWGYMTWRAAQGTKRLIKALRKPSQKVRVGDITRDFGWTCTLGAIGYAAWFIPSSLYYGIEPFRWVVISASLTGLMTLATILHMYVISRVKKPAPAVVCRAITTPADPLPAGAARPSTRRRAPRRRRARP